MDEERVSERAKPEPGQIAMPFYIVCDVSYSMVNDMDKLNDGLQRLSRAIIAEPAVDDVAHVGILSFSDSAKVEMPLTQLSEQHRIPPLTVRGGTEYGAAFRELAQVIGADIPALKALGYKVFRPCAFFLSDGEPQDRDWEQSFRDALTYDPSSDTGMKMHPVFVPFGFRAAPEHVLRRLAYPVDRGKWYHAKTHDVEEALAGILDIIMNTIISTGKTATTAQPSHVQAAAPPGISQGDADSWV